MYLLSADAGATWWHADAALVECGDGIRSVVSDGSAIVIVRSGGQGSEVCVSNDAGTSFTAIDLGDVYFESRAIYDGAQFIVYASGEAWRSSDGTTWQSTPTTPAITPGAVAVDNEGNDVAVRGGWQVWYEDQEFHRSSDGVTWEALAAGAFNGSHPVDHLAFGWLADVPACR